MLGEPERLPLSEMFTVQFYYYLGQKESLLSAPQPDFNSFLVDYIWFPGGLSAVIYTDALQTLVMVVGAFILMVLSMYHQRSIYLQGLGTSTAKNISGVES